jgi:hypothetical protein
VLRRIFGPERDEIREGWRKLNNDELHNMLSSLNIIRIIKQRRTRWAAHAARMRGKRNAYRALMGKPKGTRPIGRHGRKWEDNIKENLGEIE